MQKHVAPKELILVNKPDVRLAEERRKRQRSAEREDPNITREIQRQVNAAVQREQQASRARQDVADTRHMVSAS